MILVTGATGMFGRRVVRELSSAGLPVRALTRSAERAEGLRGPGVEPAVGDMGEPASMARALDGVRRVFLVAPMEAGLARLEATVIEAARGAGVELIVKLYGAVRHEGDALARLHQASLEALQASGVPWCLVSPNTVMESNLLPLAPGISQGSAIWVPAGTARIGMVAADDVARCAAAVLAGSGHAGSNYEITGPEALSYAEIAEAFSRVLGRRVSYSDVPEEAFRKILVDQAGYPADEVEMTVLCHFRAFRRGGADLVTDTCERLTGRRPLSVEEFIRGHRSAFE